MHPLKSNSIGLATGGSSRSRLAIGRAARVYYNSSTVPATGRSGGSIMPATGSCSREQSSTSSYSGRSYRHNGNRDRMHISTIVRSVDRRRISAISIVIAGIAALSVC